MLAASPLCYAIFLQAMSHSVHKEGEAHSLESSRLIFFSLFWFKAQNINFYSGYSAAKSVMSFSVHVVVRASQIFYCFSKFSEKFYNWQA